MWGLARPRGARGLTRALALALALASGCAGHTDPNVVLPERLSRSKASGPDPGPPDRGDIEITLGVVTTAVAAMLVVLGSFSARQAATLRDICRGPQDYIGELPDPRCVDPTGFDPFVGATVSSALAFTFAVPIAVGGGFLLRKGVRMRQAFRNEQSAAKLSLRPWLEGQRGAGLGLSLRF